MTVSPPPTQRRNIRGGAIGNTLEYYDFAVYGFLAPILGKAFFPSDDQFASLMAAFGVMAVGNVVRPLGSILFGHIGDQCSRGRCGG